MSQSNNKLSQESYSVPTVDYVTLMGEIRKRQFTKNDIKSFVYKVFSMYERATCDNVNVSADEFKPFIDENIYVDFPEYQIRNWEEWKTWHHWIHDMLVSDDHEIESIKVDFLADGRYQATFDVHWRAEFKEGSYVENQLRQVWIMHEEEGKDLPVIERYIAKMNDPMVVSTQ
ncbi:hypothetical protein [Flammeovirga sp. OC4]|uniref:hypothetical protein n=1 Tax=Flammeovirga sp. OC4 TaxID=1382345 RepID=UPI001C1075AD|nr:hypothetical protein [Flammeovirga sp. OC4]